jgi:leader peptidase (prepilin peptidase)/N-methyltransferase
MGLLLALAGVLGLLIGSFLNVVIHRVPIGASVVSPPSHCPACEQPIRPRDNVPVLSWVVLRGRCAHCGAPISAR